MYFYIKYGSIYAKCCVKGDDCLIIKSHEKTDCAESFGTIPKWVWNVPLSEITKDEIINQFAGFKQKDGYAGVMIVLWNNDGYMTEEYFRKYEYALEAAEEYGLKIIIWDENGFPSGFAGGEIERDYPEYNAKMLDITEFIKFGGETAEADIPDGVLDGCVAVNLNTNERIDISGYVENGHLRWTVPDGSWRIMLFCIAEAEVNNGGFHPVKLVDYLDKNAVKKFIELPHQRYYDRFSGYFGNVIKYAFYDEPSFWHIDGGKIWTLEFKHKFINKYGFSPVTLYPALWYDIGSETAWARNMLLGFRAELYAEEYVGTLAEWCHAHNILLTGHMDQEEIINPVPISGDLMKTFKRQDIPGVDEIMFYGRGSSAYKIISSAAICYDKERVMCETFGAMGEDMPVNVLFKETIDMLAKGINFFVPHGTWYSNDPRKIIFPPELSFRSDKFAEALAKFNKYAEKCSAILSGGRNKADIAILYPIHDLQAQFYFGVGEAYKGGVNPKHSDYLKLGEILSLDIRRDFVFIHPEILDEKCQVTDSALRLDNQVNYQDFKVIIIPGMEVISTSNLRIITEFYNSGGTVICTSKLPSKSTERGCDGEIRNMISAIFENEDKNSERAYFLPHYNSESLKNTLDSVGIEFDVIINVSEKLLGGNLSYIHKIKDDTDIYFIGNSSDDTVSAEISLNGVRVLSVIDTDSNVSEGIPVKYKHDNGRTNFTLKLPPVSSVFII